MAMGCDEQRFWKLNPTRVKNIYVKAYQLKSEHNDRIAWLNGVYVYQAIASCLSGKKGKNTYPERPLSEQPKKRIEVTDLMTEAEKEEKRQMLFDQLGFMQANFELSKKRKKG